MPELVPHSTPTVPETTEEKPPFPWEDHPAFRFTFLMYFTQPGDREALEHIGMMLYDHALELSGKWPAWKESPTRTELRAAMGDVRHIEAFLRSIAAERQNVSLDAEDERLSFLAGEYAERARSLAYGLQTMVGLPLGAIFR